jgi:hypothetical protein
MNPINNQSKPLVMKKMFLLIAEVSLVISLFIYGGLKAYGQDIIVKKSGDEIKSKVEQVLDTEIKYRKADNLTGPLYSISKSEVFMIRYANGTKDMFGNEPVPVTQEKKQEKKISITDSDLRPARNGTILAGVIAAPILGLGIAAGTIKNQNEVTIPMGSVATLILAIGVPIANHMSAKTRYATNVEGSKGLRIAGWVGYGLCLIDAVYMITVASSGGDVPSGPVYSTAIVGAATCIIFAVESNMVHNQASSLKKTTMVLPTISSVRDPNGHQYPTAGIRINF